MESPTTVAVIPMLDGLQSQRVEMLVLADVPALPFPSRRPLHDLLYPLPVVVSLGFDVRHLVYAEHVGVHQPVKLLLVALTKSGTIIDADLKSILATLPRPAPSRTRLHS